MHLLFVMSKFFLPISELRFVKGISKITKERKKRFHALENFKRAKSTGFMPSKISRGQNHLRHASENFERAKTIGFMFLKISRD
jgi:hypothetical protein